MRVLLLHALGTWSYDEVHALLVAPLPSLARALGLRRVPAASTVAAWAAHVPPEYLTDLLGRLARRIPTRRPHLAGDGTGLSLHRWERWNDPSRGHGRHRTFLKLHALVVTRAQFPYFVAARTTDDRTNDVTELVPLLAQLPTRRRIGAVALDRGYVSRRNAQAIVDRGGRPVIALRVNTTRWHGRGVPAWRHMVFDQLHHRREFACRYRRRAVIEGLFGAFKDRFGSWVRSRRWETQQVEVLSRAVVWNALAVGYHRGRW